MSPNINIDEDRRAYTTGDIIVGDVDLTIEKATVIEDLNLELLGREIVRPPQNSLNTVAGLQRRAERVFLKMPHPIEARHAPPRTLFKSRQHHKVPFAFTVPQTLLPYACRCVNGAEKAGHHAHLSLPPTFSTWKPSNTRIIYAISVQFRLRFSDGTSTLVRREREVKILPLDTTSSNFDLSPAAQCSNDGLTPLSGAIGDSRGHLEASIVGAPCLFETHASFGEDISASALLINLHLEYCSVHGAQSPPVLQDMTMKVCSVTASRLDSTAEDKPRFEPKTTEQIETVLSRNLSLKDLVWTTCQPPAQSDAAIVTPRTRSKGHLVATPGAEPGDPRANSASRAYSTFMTVRIPASQLSASERRKLWVPIFRTCNVSRRYIVRLELSSKFRSCQTQASGYTGSAAFGIKGALRPSQRLHLEATLQLFHKRLGWAQSGTPKRSDISFDGKDGSWSSVPDNLYPEEPPEYASTLPCK